MGDANQEKRQPPGNKREPEVVFVTSQREVFGFWQRDDWERASTSSDCNSAALKGGRTALGTRHHE